MLRNWRFDIFNAAHWNYAWEKWNDGWVIDDPKEWAFVLIILTFIPLWLTSWAALSLIPWGKIFLNVILFPMRAFRNLFYKPVKIIAKTAGVPVVKKKKSYKEIRPRGTPRPDYRLQRSGSSRRTERFGQTRSTGQTRRKKRRTGRLPDL